MKFALVAVLFLALVSGCTNTLRSSSAPDPWAASGAVVSGQTLVWTDLRTAALNCGDPLLRSVWDQLFPLPASDPNSSVNAQVTLGEVRGVSSNRGISVAALDLDIGIDGFASIGVSDASQGAAPTSPSLFTITRSGEVRNLQFGPKLFPRLVALFSPEDLAKRQDINTPGAMDVVVGLRYMDSAQKQVEVQIAPPISGIPSSITVNVGDYGSCLKQALKISN